MYNLNYAPTTFGVQSWREIISGGRRTKKFEYHWSKAWVFGRLLAGIASSNPAGSMDVCCACCVLSGRGLCVGLIIRPEESYRVWCVQLSVIVKPRERGKPWLENESKSATRRKGAVILTSDVNMVISMYTSKRCVWSIETRKLAKAVKQSLMEICQINERCWFERHCNRP
jgi:hypothetical protein